MTTIDGRETEDERKRRIRGVAKGVDWMSDLKKDQFSGPNFAKADYAEVELKLLSQLSRERIVKLLESVGIACFDSESTDKLLEALKVNIQDGTISLDFADMYGGG